MYLTVTAGLLLNILPGAVYVDAPREALHCWHFIYIYLSPRRSALHTPQACPRGLHIVEQYISTEDYVVGKNSGADMDRRIGENDAT